MPLSARQAVEAEAARRMLSDEHFNTLLDRMIKAATEQAILLTDRDEREAARQLVLAIIRLRAELEADASLPDETARADALAREME